LIGDEFDIAAGKPLPHTLKWMSAIIFNSMKSIDRDAGHKKLYQILVIRTILLFEMVLKGIKSHGLQAHR